MQLPQAGRHFIFQCLDEWLNPLFYHPIHLFHYCAWRAQFHKYKKRCFTLSKGPRSSQRWNTAHVVFVSEKNYQRGTSMHSERARPISACFSISDGATGSHKTLFTNTSNRRVTLASICIHINLILNWKVCSTHGETFVKRFPQWNPSPLLDLIAALAVLPLNQFVEMNFNLINFFHWIRESSQSRSIWQNSKRLRVCVGVCDWTFPLKGRLIAYQISYQTLFFLLACGSQYLLSNVF